jgi:hypothetical protein
VQTNDVEPRVKGLTLRTMIACYRELRGVAAEVRAQELMEPGLRDSFRKGVILSGSWYPLAWYRDMHRAMRTATGEGVELARRLGYLATKLDMQRIHNRLISTFVSPQVLLKFGGLVFNSYYDTGTFKVVEGARGHARARLDGCVGFNHTVYVDCVGGSMALLEGAGAKEVRLHILDGGRDGDEHMEFEAYWV